MVYSSIPLILLLNSIYLFCPWSFQYEYSDATPLLVYVMLYVSGGGRGAKGGHGRSKEVFHATSVLLLYINHIQPACALLVEYVSFRNNRYSISEGIIVSEEPFVNPRQSCVRVQSCALLCWPSQKLRSACTWFRPALTSCTAALLGGPYWMDAASYVQAVLYRHFVHIVSSYPYNYVDLVT